MSARKLWKVIWPATGQVERPESKSAAYRYVNAQVANYQCHALRSSRLNVLVDERDGQGWQLYEVIDLAELAKSEQVTER